MSNQFSKKSLRDEEFGTEKVKIEKLLHIIRNNQYSGHVKEYFKDELLLEKSNIVGTKKLVDFFETTNRLDDKIDIVTTLDNVSIREFRGQFKELVLEFNTSDDDRFTEDILEATSIYSFKSDFYMQLFNMKGYANFCLGKDDDFLEQYLIENTKVLIDRFSKDDNFKKRYRLIKDNDEYYLRALTSAGKYHDYDNALALFIGISAIDKYSSKSNQDYEVIYADFDESRLNVGFSRVESIDIPNVGQLKLIAELKNDEIKRDRLSFKIRYLLKTTDGKNLNFRPRGENIEDSIMSITHSASLASLSLALDEMNNLKSREDEMVKFINDISKLPVTNEFIYTLFRRLTSRQSKLKKAKKEELFKVQETVENTYALLDILGKINSINASVDDRIYIEYVLFEVLKEAIDR